MTPLNVKQSRKEDVYADIVRIPKQYRYDKKGKFIPEGSICSIKTVNGKKEYAQLRGTGKATKADSFIYMDLIFRNKIGVLLNNEYDFIIEKASILGEFYWAYNASNPAYRIPAKIGLISLFLGLVGLALGVWSVFPKCR